MLSKYGMFQFYSDVPHFQSVAHLLIIISFLFYFFWKLSSIFSIQTIFSFKIIVVGIQQKAFSSQIHSSFVVHQHLQLKILLFELIKMKNKVLQMDSTSIYNTFYNQHQIFKQVESIFFCKLLQFQFLQISFSPLPFRRGDGGEVLFLLQL